MNCHIQLVKITDSSDKLEGNMGNN